MLNMKSMLNKSNKIRDLFYYNDNMYPFSSVYEISQEAIVIIDYGITEIDTSRHIFNYEYYTQKQNELMNSYTKCFRLIADETLNDEIERLFDTNFDFDRTSYMDRSSYAVDNSTLEHFFEERFQEVYGMDALQYVRKEYGLIDSLGNQFFYDFVVETDNHIIAVEENGVRYHHPQIIGIDKYRKQLMKQNTFAASGGKLFRWSSQDCRHVEKVNEDIRTFFGDKKKFISNGLLIGERGVKLYEHQVNTLNQIRQERKEGKNAFLVSFPTAAGKSKIVEEDLYQLLLTSPNINACIVSPTTTIKNDWLNRMLQSNFNKISNLTIGESLNEQIAIGTYYILYSNVNKLQKDHFDYIVVDEAHHAVAPMLKRSLQYFTPKFLIGLSATPFRSDNEKLEDVFGNYEIQLDLDEAMEKGIIVKARAFRIKTNLDLSEVRFNGRNFVNADLEKKIRVQSRNEVIAKTIHTYFNTGKFKKMQGVIFCVNLNHTDAIASEMNKLGLNAVALNGRVDVNKVLKKYHNKEIRFLCSCQILNEGWDSPQTEIVVMARPTLSKSLYLQQLGRGFRKYEGKDHLYVIDVVDQYGSLAIPWSMNSIFKNPYYVPFGEITRRYQVGDMVEFLGLSEKILRVEEININTFESLYADYLSEEQAARELYISTTTLRNWVRNKSVVPDLYVPFGSKKISFFTQENIVRIREIKGLSIHDETTIYKDFWAFIEAKVYTFSFKMVFILSLIKSADLNGEALLENIQDYYKRFYLDRVNLKMIVDRRGNIYTEEYLRNQSSLNSSILTNPFEKFERKRFVFYSKELSIISFNPFLWDQFSEDDLLRLESTLFEHLAQYYENMDGLQNIDYLRRRT